MPIAGSSLIGLVTCLLAPRPRARPALAFALEALNLGARTAILCVNTWLQKSKRCTRSLTLYYNTWYPPLSFMGKPYEGNPIDILGAYLNLLPG